METLSRTRHGHALMANPLLTELEAATHGGVDNVPFAEIARRARAVANALAGPPARIGIALPSGADFAVTLFGVLGAGHLAVLIPHTLPHNARLALQHRFQLRTIVDAVPAGTANDWPG